MIKKNDRILITGGTGFIGRQLAQRCLAYTPHVACFGLPADARMGANPHIRYTNIDMTDAAGIQHALKQEEFEYVFNLGGYIDHTSYFKGGRKVIDVHYTGLLNLIDCLNMTALKRFVQIGSSDEYGNTEAPQKEAIRENPISPYSLAKTAGSHFIKMLSETEGFPGVVVRFFLVYGPGQDTGRFLPQIITACLKGETFKTSKGKQVRDFCYIDDVIEAVIRSATAPEAAGQIINVASGRPVSIRSVITKVVALIGSGKPAWGAYPYRKGENMKLYADISKARKFLKWKPSIDLNTGLKKTIDYYSILLKNYAKEGMT